MLKNLLVKNNFKTNFLSHSKVNMFPGPIIKTIFIYQLSVPAVQHLRIQFQKQQISEIFRKNAKGREGQ